MIEIFMARLYCVLLSLIPIVNGIRAFPLYGKGKYLNQTFFLNISAIAGILLKSQEFYIF